MAKTFKLTVSDRTPLARSKRLREAGASVYITGVATTVATTATTTVQGITQVSTMGNGNAVTDGSVSSDSKTLLLRKEATFLTESGAGDMFLRKDQDDSTDYVLGMGAAAVAGALSVGGAAAVAGAGTFNDTLTVDGVLYRGDSTISGSSGTGQFADGFDGYGWRLWNRGTDGDDHHLTLDSLTVRRTMTVYELLIQKIRAIGGQFIISAANGTIATVTASSLYYVLTFEDECMFQAHDLIRCQTFTGNTLKSYWVEVQSPDRGNKAIRVLATEFGDAVPEVGDEVVLCGNTSDTSRQSVIVLSATEDGLPRIDLHDGVNSKAFSFVAEGETLGTLRVRTGKLDDITDDWFPTDNQPQGYGLYGGNAYLRGTFVLADSGDDVSTLFQVIQGNITALITANEQANYLSNSTFATDMSGWEVGDGCAIVYDDLAGRNVLEMAASGRTTASMVQLGENYAMQPTFDKDEEGNIIARNFNLQFYAYGAGVNARFYMEGGDTTLDEAITFDLRGWTYYDIAFTAKSFGDFVMAVSAGTLHLYNVRIVADNVTYFTTLFSQTVGSISLISSRLTAAEGSIAEMEQAMAGFITTAEAISIIGGEVPGLISSWFRDTDNIDAFALMFAAAADTAGNEVSALLGTFVGKTYDEQTGEWRLESAVYAYADNIRLEGYVTVNDGFSIDKEGNMTAVNGTFSGKITSTEGTIGGFTIGDTTISAAEVQSYSSTSLILSSATPDIKLNYTANNIDRTVSLSTSLLSFKDASRPTPYGTQFVNWWAGSGSFSVTSLYGAQNIEVHNDTYSEGNVGIAIAVDGFIADADADALYGNHALYIEKGDICGFRLRTRRINSATTLDKMDSVILVTAAVTITLPTGCEDGQIYFIKNISSGTIRIQASGDDHINCGRVRSDTYKDFADGYLVTLIYDSVNHLWHGGWTNSD